MIQCFSFQNKWLKQLFHGHVIIVLALLLYNTNWSTLLSRLVQEKAGAAIKHLRPNFQWRIILLKNNIQFLIVSSRKRYKMTVFRNVFGFSKRTSEFVGNFSAPFVDFEHFWLSLCVSWRLWAFPGSVFKCF